MLALSSRRQFHEPLAGTRETAHHRADGNVKNVCRFPVCEVFAADENENLPLVQGQAVDGTLDLRQNQPAEDRPLARVADQLRMGRDIFRHAFGFRSSEVIDPMVPEDTEHPGVEPGPRRPTVRIGQRALACPLDEIVRK